jgi:hypothetical protein
MKLETLVIREIAKYQPETASECRELCSFKLRKLGKGIYREVYKVVGADLVIKFPLKEEKTFKDHSRLEYRACRKVLLAPKKYWAIISFIPEIPHYNPTTGVLIMEYCTPVKTLASTKQCTKLIAGLVTRVVDLSWKGYRSGLADMHSGNLGFSKASDHLKIIDLGYFFN